MNDEQFGKMSGHVNDMLKREKDIEDQSFYKMAMDDLKNNNINEEMWAACHAQVDFEKKKAIALYLRKMAERYRNQYQPNSNYSSWRSANSGDADEQAHLRRKREREEEIKRINEANEQAYLRRKREREEKIKRMNAPRILTEKDGNIDPENSHSTKSSSSSELNENFSSESRGHFSNNYQKENTTSKSPDFIYKYLRPSVGAILFSFVGSLFFSSFIKELAGILAILMGVCGWFAFLAVRGMLIPSFYESKRFYEKPKEYLPKMLLVSLAVSTTLISLSQIF